MSARRPDEALRPRNGDSTDGAPAARRMVRDERAADLRRAEARTYPPGATASADAVEQVRRSITDIKHDVRMLKVVLDKQSLAIERVLAAVEDLGSTEEE